MSKTNLWYIEFGIQMETILNKGKLSIGAMADRTEKLTQIAKRLHHIYEDMCNIEISEREEKERERLVILAEGILKEMYDTNWKPGDITPYIEFCQDPRGAPMTVHVDNRAFIVPY